MDILTRDELSALLEETYLKFNNRNFIAEDPVQIPHEFSLKEDIEIAGFLTATIAWGNRKAILKSARQLMNLMDNAPYEFVMNAGESDYKQLETFYYRTFQGGDCVYFMKALKRIYTEYGGLESILTHQNSLYEGLANLHRIFFDDVHEKRAEKHLASVVKGASCKRLCMFMRWMVRDDLGGVDFGLWKSMKPSQLFLPLDVHTGNVSRQLGLLSRKANDWKSVVEVTDNLRQFDAEDPVKYDFSLFGMGIDGYFK